MMLWNVATLVGLFQTLTPSQIEQDNDDDDDE